MKRRDRYPPCERDIKRTSPVDAFTRLWYKFMKQCAIPGVGKELTPGVRMSSNRERLSVLFGCPGKEGYTKFRHSDEGRKTLVHLGKGLLTLDPYHSDRPLLSPVALAGLVTVLHACLALQPIIVEKYPYILALAMQPRMLLTVDEDLKPLHVPVRIGEAVDVVGQAGSPRTITGFRTHNTPVLLAAGERAELATEKYIPLTPVLEGFVILRKNPEHHED